ncbi:SNF2 helicase associated domain-containing protein [Bacillus thuringiensis]|uniref:Helicase SNF n=1 Tax=Bacillus thuringiensis TaxID=1428 RepID=A0A9W3TBG3_BACTU|nr:DEAD/DEAH box helicase [Bacillus thuringiensis]AQY38283.1 helicase SNF [Bacillus thuringiensis]MDR4146105.1 helicase SNF [Bacillus thuringiensis]MEC3572478.1 SNF2 helicase associated domain-containing protein [Bacillus thuringiensis]MED2020545.1 SNF2 helicase associated domain-containing protein [Bacillus thuringiensis]MED2142148.1 SNF2 helicase associated domain-containing protein [Bacillus thuringiensis]
MSFTLNKSIIKEVCGETSYKRGEAYYKSNKVIINHYDKNKEICEATVKGNEDFHVTVEKDKKGDVVAKCSCPSLSSFQTYCQHVAAVLIQINYNQQTGGMSSTSNRNDQLTSGMFQLFADKPLRPKSKQHRFDTREILDVEFICTPVATRSGGALLGIQLKLAKVYFINHIREFLSKVEKRESFHCSNEFTYTPDVHSFKQETDAIIQQLIKMYHNEKMYEDALEVHAKQDESMIFIPPASWKDMLSSLSKVEYVQLKQNEQLFQGLQVSKGLLPLHFEFTKGNNGGFTLHIDGLNRVRVMDMYNNALYDGKLYHLHIEDCMRLIELQKMISRSNSNQFYIPESKMEHFVGKVVPGLMKLGTVHIDEVISDRVETPSLKAKLYLDRVKNRLLAGLEFHYGNVMINPLEEDGQPSVFNRDEKKEKEILDIMSESAFAKTEGGYFMHNEEAEYNFLYHVVPTLKGLVDIYATTAIKLRISKGDVVPLIRVRRKERIDWLSFRFDIKGIPEAEIKGVLAALEEKRKYYRLANGSFLSLESKEFNEINQFIKESGIRKEFLHGEEVNVPLIRSVKWMNGLHEGNVLSVDDSVQELVENIQNPKKLKFAVPNTLNAEMRKYQVYGFEWMKTLAYYRFGGILADDMGLGKTLQSIAFIDSVLPEIREKKLPILVVSPSSLVYNWFSELKKFAPHIRAVIADGNQAERRKILKDIAEFDVIITSYPLLRRDIRLYARPFHTLFLDEAQAFKNPTTQTARAVKTIQAEYRFGLTGTPVENSLEELWSIFHVVFPELLPGRKEFGDLRREDIAKRVKPFVLRRLKGDVLNELPEKIEHLQSSELLPDQKSFYAAYLAKLREETLKHLDKDTLRKNKIRILAGLTRLRQICCHPALFVDDYKGSSAKFEQLLEILEECRSTGKRILIFSQFTKMLSIIGRELNRQAIPYFYLDGSTPAQERVELCDRFNEGEGELFLISLKAGGTGLNLTGADTVILYDLWWNPAVEQQAADRAYRMGQKNTVQVIKLVAQGTIEEKMHELQESKKNLIAEVIEPGEEKLSSITEEEIRDILMI